VTIARSFSATFAGIRPADAPAFILAQLAGATLAVLFFAWLLRTAWSGAVQKSVAEMAD
jgi:glycerol uptake facilitator-like aquaporin